MTLDQRTWTGDEETRNVVIGGQGWAVVKKEWRGVKKKIIRTHPARDRGEPE